MTTLEKHVQTHIPIHTDRYRHKAGTCAGTTNFKLTTTKSVYSCSQQIRDLGEVGDIENVWESLEEDSL